MTYFTNPSHQSVSLYVSLLSLLGNTFPLQLIHDTTEELLDASFSMRYVSYQREFIGLSVYPLIVAR
jgi:hypothetical protein